ncbi:MAG TPA: TetR family transcriptional regulator [Polyangia bacterium]|nr:TetR family transcriptional regulator [Polyangia bacterium]
MPKKTAAEAEETRRHLLAVARRLFAGRGYAAVGTEEIVRAARVTRGALYHHYRDKEDLFVAVVEDVMRDNEAALRAVLARHAATPARALLAAAAAFLDLSERRDVQRVLFQDAPSVLGWRRWRALDAKYGLGLVRGALEAAMARGALARQPVRPLAHLLLGALIEAALMIAHADDPARARAEIEAPLARIVAGLRPARVRRGARP